MFSNPFFETCVLLGVVADFAILFLLTKRHLWRAWLFVGLSCVSDLTFELAIALNQTHYKRYFYLYWSSVAVASLLRIGILHNVLQSFPGVAFVRRELRLSVAGAGSMIAIGSWYFGFHGSQSFGISLQHSAVLLSQSISFAWCGFFLTALIAVTVFQLAWSRRGGLVANGLILSSGSTLIVSLLVEHLGFARTLGTYLFPVTSFATLAVWCFAVSRPDEVYQLSPTVADLLARQSESTTTQ